jgi:ribosomal protein S18 acetylase RimI-like enzyme
VPSPVLVSAENDDVLGLVAVKPGLDSDWRPADEQERDLCSVSRLSVDERARRQGVAKGLMMVHVQPCVTISRGGGGGVGRGARMYVRALNGDPAGLDPCSKDIRSRGS